MTEPANYLKTLETALLVSEIITDYTIVTPELDEFPHHCHIVQEDNVVPGKPLSLLELLTLLETELNPN